MRARAGYGLPQHGQTSARDAGSGSLRMAALDPVGTRVIEPGRLVGATVGPVVALDVVRTMTLVEIPFVELAYATTPASTGSAPTRKRRKQSTTCAHPPGH